MHLDAQPGVHLAVAHAPSCRVTGLFCGSLSSTTTRLLGLSPTGRQRSAHTVVIVCESPVRGCREPLSTTMCLAAHTETRATAGTPPPPTPTRSRHRAPSPPCRPPPARA